MWKVGVKNNMDHDTMADKIKRNQRDTDRIAWLEVLEPGS